MSDAELLSALDDMNLSSKVPMLSLLNESLVDATPDTYTEITEWVSFAKSLGSSKESPDVKLVTLNLYLESRSVVAGKGTKITVADIAVFVAVHDLVAGLSAAEQTQLPCLLRWFDYVQHKDEIQEVYEEIPVKKPEFRPPNAACLNSSSIKALNHTNGDAKHPGSGLDNVSKQAGEKKEKAQIQKKDVDYSVSVLDIRVGIIQKVWKHPTADGLYVEEIDVGEPNVRQVVSGLAKYLREDQLMKSKVLVLKNVKPGKIRDVLSSGLVLCASNEDHSVCKPVSPPIDAPVGEKVKFEGYEGNPEEVLNPKKKQLEKILPDFRTNASGIATYQGIPFMTSKGPCLATVINACIK